MTDEQIIAWLVGAIGTIAGVMGSVIAFLFFRSEKAKDSELGEQKLQTSYERDQKTELIEGLNKCNDQKIRIVHLSTPHCPEDVSDEIGRILTE